MFNSSLKNQSMRIYERAVDALNNSQKTMTEEIQSLNDLRVDSVHLIGSIETMLDSIANMPRDFSVRLGNITNGIKGFNGAENFEKEFHKANMKAGRGIIRGVAAGAGIAAMAPTLTIATSTPEILTAGTAIGSLVSTRGVGSSLAGLALNGGVGMIVARNTAIAIGGPLGIGIATLATGTNLMVLNGGNRKIANKVFAETEKVDKARKEIDEFTSKVRKLRERTYKAYSDLLKRRADIVRYAASDYMELTENEQEILDGTVDYIRSLSLLLNLSV